MEGLEQHIKASERGYDTVVESLHFQQKTEVSLDVRKARIAHGGMKTCNPLLRDKFTYNLMAGLRRKNLSKWSKKSP